MIKKTLSKIWAAFVWVLSLLRIFVGWHSIKDGSTCRISETHWDVHDYPESKGGDGIPTHFYRYTCPRCGKRFEI